jgi:hypothetical protein
MFFLGFYIIGSQCSLNSKRGRIEIRHGVHCLYTRKLASTAPFSAYLSRDVVMNDSWTFAIRATPHVSNI